MKAVHSKETLHQWQKKHLINRVMALEKEAQELKKLLTGGDFVKCGECIYWDPDAGLIEKTTGLPLCVCTKFTGVMVTPSMKLTETFHYTNCNGYCSEGRRNEEDG